MKFFIASFVLAYAALISAQPLTDMEWHAEYGRYGIDLPVQLAGTPYVRYVVPRVAKLAEPYVAKLSDPFVAKAIYDPEFFYDTFGYYPEH